MKRHVLSWVCGALLFCAASDDVLAAQTPDPDDDITAAVEPIRRPLVPKQQRREHLPHQAGRAGSLIHSICSCLCSADLISPAPPGDGLSLRSGKNRTTSSMYWDREFSSRMQR